MIIVVGKRLKHHFIMFFDTMLHYRLLTWLSPGTLLHIQW